MNTDPRSTYLNASIETASPARLLVMLCERLVLDVQRAADAADAGPLTPDTLNQVHRHLTHAQDIVIELRATLRPEAFRGGAELAAVYDYLLGQLITANVTKDAALIGPCLGLARQIATTWQETALASAAPATKSA